MKSRFAALRLLVPLVLLSELAGCQSLRGTRPVTVLVRDAETKAPISQANVRISYPLSHALCTPANSAGTTAGDGTARLTASPVEDALIVLEAGAPGYLFEWKELPPSAVEAIERVHFFEDIGSRPPSFVVELYAEPRPSIELVVPVGYKGVIKAELLAQGDGVPADGQRKFAMNIDAAGAASLTGPSILRHIESSDFVGRFADGTPLPRNPPSPAVGLWWWKRDDHCECFFVGTDAEFTALRKTERSSTTPNGSQPAEGAKRGGGGRHGRGRM
jgi:hypothetical protein